MTTAPDAPEADSGTKVGFEGCDGGCFENNGKTMNDELVILRTYTSIGLAHTDRLALEGHGIRCRVEDREWMQTNLFQINPVAYARLLVSQADVERAMEILAIPKTGVNPFDRNETALGDSCLVCGIVIEPEAVQCPACGWSWEELDDATPE